MSGTVSATGTTLNGVGDRARQISALADKLQPLGSKSRGMPIEASEWNDLVQVLSQVLAIDLAQETDFSTLADQRYARIDHEHLGQVSVTWLDADLQARTADGGGGVATRQVLADMQQKVDSLQTEVTRLTALLQTQQASTDRAAANDIDRSRQLLAVNNSVAGVQGLSTTVAQVAQAQQSLQTNIGTVLDLRKSLTDATGAPIDVSGLSTKVADLQSLRDSLTGVDGKPLRLRDLQLQVSDLSNRLPESAGGTLDARLATFASDAQQKASEDAQTKVDALRADMTSSNTSLAASLTSKLESEISSNRDAAMSAVTAQIAASEDRLNANLASGIGAARTSLASDLQNNLNDAVARNTAGLVDQIAATVDARLPGLRAQVQSDVQAALTPVLQKQVSDSTADLTTRVGTLETGVASLQSGLPAQIQASVQAVATAQQSQIDASIASQVSSQVAAAQTALGATVADQVKTQVGAGLSTVPALAGQAVDDRLKDLDTRIGTAVATATQGIPAQVSTTVDAKFAQANVAGQIATANNALATQLRGEIASSAATVQTNATSAINASNVSLRGEFNNTLNTRLPARVGVTPVLLNTRPG